MNTFFCWYEVDGGMGVMWVEASDKEQAREKVRQLVKQSTGADKVYCMWTRLV